MYTAAEEADDTDLFSSSSDFRVEHNGAEHYKHEPISEQTTKVSASLPPLKLNESCWEEL